jgi:anti-sigma regulatory factor (Ser/Thr protein kinase)
MNNRNDIVEVYDFVSEKVDHYPSNMSKLVQDKFGLTRQGATYHLNQMVKKGVLASEGRGRNKRYHEIPNHRWNKTVEISIDLDEHEIWEAIEKDLKLELPENVSFTLFYGFTEMLNNAKDHSEGTLINVAVDVFRSRVKIKIADNGVGIFKKIQKAQNLEHEQHSIIVLSKGKFTTDPTNHSGEGIFFTSRAFDFFDIVSGDLCFIHEREGRQDWLIDEVREKTKEGTVVIMDLCLTSSIDMNDLFSKFTSDPDDPSFDQTIVPVKKLGSRNGQVVSRSQGKRLMAGLGEFDYVRLDFEGISLIGQGFADEVFRVWAHRNPSIRLDYKNANSKVETMLKRVQAHQSELELK